jgi:hypothetical protein
MYKYSLLKSSIDDETEENLAEHFMIHFEDSNEEDECVYCISLNNASKQW